jgi:hypothetical protein
MQGGLAGSQLSVYMPFLTNTLHYPKYMTRCHFIHLLEETADKHLTHSTDHK